MAFFIEIVTSNHGMRIVLILIIFVASLSASFAQQALRGKVIASDSKQPIHLANVFLSNTSIGTVTNADGVFVLDRFPQGRFDVVISCIGYETYVTTIQYAQLPLSIEVILKPKVNILQEVVVEPYEKNGWERYGKFFIENFIGTSALAADCILENRALGYILRYDLKVFEYNYGTRIFYFQGYPLFEDIETDRKRLLNRWEKNRTEAYYGSMMHFMRSLFRNQLIEEGFEIRKLIKISEEEKKRVRNIYNSRTYINSNGNIVVNDSLLGNGNKDSADYYRKVMRQPEKMAVLINQLLPGDSIAFAIDSFTAGLYFDDHLQVIYKYKQAPDEYVRMNSLSVQPKTPVVSEIVLPRKNAISVLANGSYFEGLDLITSGYWGWWEKLATMLPFDYKPPKKRE